MEENTLQISSSIPCSVAHGPGQRFVLWVQGCTLGCPGCFNHHTHDVNGGQSIRVDDLAHLILGTTDIEGITISGGEPLQQVCPLTELIERLRQRQLTVLCYTGFTLNELRSRRSPKIDRLLEKIDILIDGPYVRELAAPLRWRGSRNQRIHFLSDVYRHLTTDTDDMGRVEFLIDRRGFTTTGVWPEKFPEQIARALTGGTG